MRSRTGAMASKRPSALPHKGHDFKEAPGHSRIEAMASKGAPTYCKEVSLQPHTGAISTKGPQCTPAQEP